MPTVTYTARVREDGLLEIPESAQEELGLRHGDEVGVALTRPATPGERGADNPLLRLIGIGKGGPPDGAENHDRYLYARRPA